MPHWSAWRSHTPKFSSLVNKTLRYLNSTWGRASSPTRSGQTTFFPYTLFMPLGIPPARTSHTKSWPLTLTTRPQQWLLKILRPPCNRNHPNPIKGCGMTHKSEIYGFIICEWLNSILHSQKRRGSWFPGDGRYGRDACSGNPYWLSQTARLNIGWLDFRWTMTPPFKQTNGAEWDSKWRTSHASIL